MTVSRPITALTQAGGNNDSDGLVNEALKEPGFHLNLNVINVQFITKRNKLKMKKIVPTILNQSDRYGTDELSVAIQCFKR
jgi:hypothetical protein